MFTLTLIRHAKSDWPANLTDFERPLAERGINDAGVARLLLSDRSFDLALVSAAARTRATADLLNLNCASRRELHEIYEAPPGTLLEIVNKQSVSSLVLVGHSPGMPMLSWYFTKNRDSESAQRLRLKFPTLGIATLKSDKPFSEWGEGAAELLSFEVPRFDALSSDDD
ncbi:MAG: hypothetical protein RL038_1216 [Actinomycetota bacterium]